MGSARERVRRLREEALSTHRCSVGPGMAGSEHRIGNGGDGAMGATAVLATASSSSEKEKGRARGSQRGRGRARGKPGWSEATGAADGAAMAVAEGKSRWQRRRGSLGSIRHGSRCSRAPWTSQTLWNGGGQPVATGATRGRRRLRSGELEPERERGRGGKWEWLGGVG